MTVMLLCVILLQCTLAQMRVMCNEASNTNRGVCEWSGDRAGGCGWRQSSKACISCEDMAKDECDSNSDVCWWERRIMCSGRNLTLWRGGGGDRCNMAWDYVLRSTPYESSKPCENGAWSNKGSPEKPDCVWGTYAPDENVKMCIAPP